MFTYGPRSDLATNLRCDPAAVGADFVGIRRGGDITYHGPGQLVGYPIVSIANGFGAAAHVRNVEQLVIDALATFGVTAGRLDRVPRRVGRPGRAEPAQDLRHRGAPQAGPHDARLRPQRDDRPDVHARAHRGVRHRRPAGDVARRGGRRRDDARGRRRRRPPRRRALGRRPLRAPGRRVAPSRRRPVAVLPGRRPRRAGAPRVAAGRGGGDVGAGDRVTQAGVAAPEGAPRPRGPGAEAARSATSTS